MAPDPLPVESLYQRCDPASLDFTTTDDLADLDEIIGQDRALAAIRFGIGIKREGYNLFALGPPGAGKHTTLKRYLEETAAQAPVPDDWCYLFNFEMSHKPVAVRLPAGLGRQFRQDMAQLVADLKSAIPAAFESDDYRNRRQVIEEEFKQRQETAFDDLQNRAKDKGIALIRTPMGFGMAPVKDGEVLKPEEFETLSETERHRIEADIEDLQKQLQGIVQQIPSWAKDHGDRVRDLNREVSAYAVGHLIDAVRERYRDHAAIGDYLAAVRKDVGENVDSFLGQKAEGAQAVLAGGGMPGARAGGSQPSLGRYEVNLVIDNGEAKGAPVVFEDHPSHANLVGRIEHLSEMGALVTDFRLIKPGALHRANGGYLLLDARRLLMQPNGWEALKSALRGKEVRIESLGQAMSLVSTVSLDPAAIPLDLKVVLIGDRRLYYLLCQYEPDFSELFKVAADFDDEMDRHNGVTQQYARLVATVARREGLKPLDRDAVARVIEHSARLAGDNARLTSRIGSVADVMREADYWAGEATRKVVSAADIEQAIDAQIHRADRLRERSHEMIERDIMMISTDGAEVGQVNGLSVLSLGNFSFGRPSRITARVRMGGGEVIDIERKVELGGPLHSKGVLILAGYLGATFATDHPLSLGASLVFEQSYGGVDGDSASSTELYALLSALSGLPIRQSLAVTGSVNQLGEVQAIGGANEKIEGFFDVCRRKGLTGEQGVMIPAANVTHLMLRRDVVEACAEGRFQVFPVATIAEGIELLTGVPAGVRDADGAFPEGTVFHLVEQRLKALAEARKAFGATGKGTEDEESKP